MCAALACAAPAAQSSTESGRRRGKNGASAAGGDLIRNMAGLGARPLETARDKRNGTRMCVRTSPWPCAHPIAARDDHKSQQAAL